MKVINPSSLPLRRTLPLGLEGILAIATALLLWRLSGHVYCDRATMNGRFYAAWVVLFSLPATWLLMARGTRPACVLAWTLVTVRLLLAAFVLSLGPGTADWYLEC
ncbi:hypothetical protein [Streptomyces sp. NBC_01236]|uniref:hypothetical protein n=1 Tax=Streptomyces sp. NBC_01236 TaxID=2903789 RepID=UPI002E13296B|nr:hypothetical protein OG324_19185 [Streptomyces sp. NBC_01236]